GARLVHAFEVLDVRHGRRRADADRGHLDAVGAKARGELRHQVALVPRDCLKLLARARVVGVARVREYAGEAEGARVGDEAGDVAEAACGEGARLGERRDGDAAGVAFGLYARDLGALVRLDVRAQVRAEALNARRHARGVAAHALDVEDERRRLNGS